MGVPGLYRVLYDYVPGYQGLRVPSRFAALLFMFLALLASAGAAVLERRSRTLAIALTGLAVIVFLGLASPGAMPLNQPLVVAGTRNAATLSHARP